MDYLIHIILRFQSYWLLNTYIPKTQDLASLLNKKPKVIGSRIPSPVYPLLIHMIDGVVFSQKDLLDLSEIL